MKIMIHSDLHLEFGPNNDIEYLGNPDYDVLVLAGDITTFYTRPDLYRIASKANGRPVVMVMGNHDYYGSDIQNRTLLDVIRDYTRGLPSNFHVLHRESLLIGDVLFIGITGWPMMDVFPEYAAATQTKIEESISDFHHIRGMTYDRMKIEAIADKEYLHSISATSRSENKVVLVTHFPIATKFLNKEFDISYMSNYFTNEYLNSISFRPDVYIYGHNHDKAGLRYYYETECITNQLGYPSEVLGHRQNNIIEV